MPGAATPGQGATITESPPVRWVHSSSVTNGITGWISRSSRSSTCPSTALVFAAAAASSPDSGTFASSRYQSQNSSQAKWYSASHALPNSNCSNSPSTSTVTAASRDRIQRSAVDSAERSPGPGNAAPASAPCSNANLAAFHSLLQKFLAPAAHSSLTATALPGLALRARVNRVASAPKRSIQSSGSTVFPRDLDIFLPYW